MSIQPYLVSPKIDTSVFAVKLGNLRRLTPQGMKLVIGQSAGRIGVRLARLTYPKDIPSQKGAILRDSVKNVWRTPAVLMGQAKRKFKWVSGAIFGALQKGEILKAEKYFEQAGMKVKVAKRADKARHQSLRVRSQQMTKRGTDDVLIMDRGEVERFAQGKADRQSGHAAGGWLAASRTLRKPRASDYVPDFKKRKSRRNSGTSFFTGSGDQMTATIRNKVPYIRRPFNEGMVIIAKVGEVKTIAAQMRTLVRKGYATKAQITDIQSLFTE